MKKLASEIAWLQHAVGWSSRQQPASRAALVSTSKIPKVSEAWIDHPLTHYIAAARARSAYRSYDGFMGKAAVLYSAIFILSSGICLHSRPFLSRAPPRVFRWMSPFLLSIWILSIAFSRSNGIDMDIVNKGVHAERHPGEVGADVIKRRLRGDENSNTAAIDDAELNEMKLYHRRFHEKVRHQEKLAESYYENQKKERDYKNPVNSDAMRIGSNYPCLYGTNVIGLNTALSILDGHKYSCGLNAIKSAPIIYSFGSDQRQDFELEILDLRPDAKIFVFEIDQSLMVPVNQRKNSISYNNLGLGYPNSVQRNDAGFIENAGNLKNFSSIMHSFGHTYVDLIKIDCEGCEWDFLEREGNILSRVGQILIEVHSNVPEKVFNVKAKSLISFVDDMEKHNMRLYHKEPNLSNPVGIKCCSEFSFIQRDWYDWNHHLKFNLTSIQM